MKLLAASKLEAAAQISYFIVGRAPITPPMAVAFKMGTLAPQGCPLSLISTDTFQQLLGFFLQIEPRILIGPLPGNRRDALYEVEDAFGLVPFFP